jgi:DNA-binding NtrC family response regulator
MSRILIFDAYPSIREILADELAADGSIVVPIGNPESIAGAVIAFEPDLFIMDPYIRRGMKWELFDAVKKQNPKLPILLFTESSFPDPHFTQADGCLSKSYVLDKLKQKIKETLEKRLLGKRDSETISARAI